MRIQFIICFLFCSLFIQAAKVDTLSVYSPTMDKYLRPYAIIPDSYDNESKPFPVLYLLHGGWADASVYLKQFPMVLDYADQYNMIIVCSDGGYTSWYLNSPVDSSMQYETFTADELVEFIDANYHTIQNRTGRAITGVSMGGYGALYLSFRHQDVFGAAGSMSGVIDFRKLDPKVQVQSDLVKRLGERTKYPANWDNNTVITQLKLLKGDSLAIIFDCGANDEFDLLRDNRMLHHELNKLAIPHDYIERPGKHNYAYFRNAIQYQFLYFHHYFLNNN